VSGLSSLPINQDGDKAVCGAKVGILEFRIPILDFRF